MFCSNCGSKNDDNSPFCGNCGARLNAAAPPPTQAAPPPPPPPQYAPAPPPPPPKKKRHGCLWGCLSILVVVAILVGGLYLWISGAFLSPGYTAKDYDSAMQKVGVTIDFEGMDATQLTAFVKAHRGEKFALADYDIAFSDYQEKTFSLTQVEANAFVNGVAPNFSWFDSIRFTINSDGSVTGKYKVDFKKVKDELIPDLLGDIPPQVSAFLPDTFSLTTRGTASIVDNRVVVPEPLSELAIGPIPLQPIIRNVAGGPLDESSRQQIFDITSRIYTEIPDLQIHSLKVQDGQFYFSGYVPTHVTVTEK